MNSRSYMVPFRDLAMLSLITLGFGLLVARAVHLQVTVTEDLQAEGKARYLRNETITANRGLIKDRNGEILAISTAVDSVWAEPKILSKHADRWTDLAKEIQTSETQIRQDVEKYNTQNRQFMYLKRHLSPQQAKRVQDLKVPGVSLMREYRRYYPHGSMAANLIGFTNIDDIGLEGIELSMNHQLEGKSGENLVIKDRHGRTIETLAHTKRVQDGKDVYLSIDSRIQQTVYTELLAVVAKERAALATSVVVDISTGEILALAAAPSFNPNVVSDRMQTRNFVATDVFEPGSTAKPFVVAKALMEGVVTPQTMIDTSPGWIQIGGFTIKDIRNFGELSVEDVIMKSSNIGLTKIGTQIDPNHLMDFYRSIGFGSTTGSGISGENDGIFRDRTKWYAGDHATLTYGYGISVTALQLIQAYTMLANGGVLVPLTIMANEKPQNRRRVLPTEIAAEITRMMERVVTPTGTSRRAKMSLYRVAGKSATVQKLINKEYSDKHHIAIFAGFAPASNPRLATVVIVDDPRAGSHYGGAIAAPAFREIMSKSLRILNVPPDDLDRFAKKEDVRASVKS